MGDVCTTCRPRIMCCRVASGRASAARSPTCAVAWLRDGLHPRPLWATCPSEAWPSATLGVTTGLLMGGLGKGKDTKAAEGCCIASCTRRAKSSQSALSRSCNMAATGCSGKHLWVFTASRASLAHRSAARAVPPACGSTSQEAVGEGVPQAERLDLAGDGAGVVSVEAAGLTNGTAPATADCSCPATLLTRATRRAARLRCLRCASTVVCRSTPSRACSRACMSCAAWS